MLEFIAIIEFDVVSLALLLLWLKDLLAKINNLLMASRYKKYRNHFFFSVCGFDNTWNLVMSNL